ncbi:MAG: hypothetical protein V5A24_04205 [Haloarculaceae archaeon]
MTSQSDIWESVWTEVRGLPLGVVVPVLVVVALAATAVQWFTTLAVGTDVRLLGLAVVGAAVVAGRPARWGSAAALLGVGAVVGTWTTAVTWAVAAFVTSTVATRLWASEGIDGGWPTWTRRYVFVTVVGVLLFAATGAWLLDVLGLASFSVTVGRTVATNLPVAIVGAPLVRLVSERTPGSNPSAPERPQDGGARAGVTLVVLVWTVGGYVGSFLFRTVEQVPPGEIGRQFSTTLETVLFAWGPQGTYAQLVLGLVALVVVGVLLRK